MDNIEEMVNNFLNLITMNKKIYDLKLIFSYKSTSIKEEDTSDIEKHIENKVKSIKQPDDDNSDRNNSESESRSEIESDDSN